MLLFVFVELLVLVISDEERHSKPFSNLGAVNATAGSDGDIGFGENRVVDDPFGSS